MWGNIFYCTGTMWRSCKYQIGHQYSVCDIFSDTKDYVMHSSSELLYPREGPEVAECVSRLPVGISGAHPGHVPNSLQIQFQTLNITKAWKLVYDCWVLCVNLARFKQDSLRVTAIPIYVMLSLRTKPPKNCTTAFQIMWNLYSNGMSVCASRSLAQNCLWKGP